MSKLYRSLLWSGLVVAGVAACGDDVTVQPPPPPPAPTVHSVAVAPNPASVAVAGTLPMVATVNADAGVATTVTWSSTNAAVATVGASTGIVTGVATGSVGITACSTVVTTVCGSSSVTVTAATTPIVNSVTITPSSAPVFVGGTLQAVANVSGLNNPPQTVTWTSLSPGIASVNATGLITGVSNGTAVIRACSTLAGFTTVCGTADITVSTPAPASVQVTGLTWVPPTGPTVCTQGPGPVVPVVLTSVRCQIEITVQVNSGDQQLERVDVRIDGQVMASQTFGVTPVGAELAPISSTITLSTNTAQVRRISGLLVPVVTNGNAGVDAQLFVVGSSTPVASNAIPVVMNNTDAIVALGATGAIPAVTLVADALTPTVTDDGGNAWFTGSSTVAGIQYIAFSEKVPTSVGITSDNCGSSSSTVTGTATTGIALSGVFSCAGFEGANTITGFDPPTYTPPLNGPDGTPLTPPTALSNLGGGFTVAGDLRWNLITPAVPAQTLPTLFIDNSAPAAVIGNVAFNDAFDQDWINGSFNLLAEVSAPDPDGGPVIGGTTIASESVRRVVGATCPLPDLPNPHGLAETLTSSGFDSYQVCGVVTDHIGNVGVSGASNPFGVDTGAPSHRLIFSAGVDPVGVYTTPNVSATPNTSKYQTIAALANMPWGIEAIDTRSGFNQSVVAGNDAAIQSLLRLSPTANNTSACSPPLSDQLITTLSDAWKRTILPIPGQDQLDCGAGVGYYFYSGQAYDRAGNLSQLVTTTTVAPIVRNFVFDPGTPNITGLGFASTFYTPGAPGSFGISGNDDLSIITGTVAFAMNGLRAPAVGIKYPHGSLNPLGTEWATTQAQLTSVLNGALITVPYMLFRIDDSCEFNADPYPSCDVATNGTGSKPASAADYNTNLNIPNGGGNPLTNAGKLPTAALANIADIVGRESVVGIIAPMLASQFSPSTGSAAPWGGAGCGPLSATCADIANWTASIVGSSVIAVHKTQTSNGLTVFNPSNFDGAFDGASLWRLDTVTNQYTFCGNMTAPTVPTIDNGSFRTWHYTFATSAIPTACTSLAGPYKVMGTRTGAGLFTLGF